MKDLFEAVKVRLPANAALPQCAGQALLMKGMLRRIQHTWDSLQVGAAAHADGRSCSDGLGWCVQHEPPAERGGRQQEPPPAASSQSYTKLLYVMSLVCRMRRPSCRRWLRRRNRPPHTRRWQRGCSSTSTP